MTEEQVAQMIRNLLLEMQQLSRSVVALAEATYYHAPPDTEQEADSEKLMESCKKQGARLDSLVARLAKTK